MFPSNQEASLHQHDDHGDSRPQQIVLNDIKSKKLNRSNYYIKEPTVTPSGRKRSRFAWGMMKQSFPVQHFHNPWWSWWSWLCWPQWQKMDVLYENDEDDVFDVYDVIIVCRESPCACPASSSSRSLWASWWSRPWSRWSRWSICESYDADDQCMMTIFEMMIMWSE